LGGGAAYLVGRRRAGVGAGSRGLGAAARAVVADDNATRRVSPVPVRPENAATGRGPEAIDDLLAQITREVRGREGLPVTRLLLKTELGDKAIAWSFPGTAGADLDVPAATALLNARLARIGLRLSGGGMFTSDDDASCMVFWRIGTVQTDLPDNVKDQIEELEKLESAAAKSKAAEMVSQSRYDLLLWWLRQGRHFGIPAEVLRKVDDVSTARALITLVKEGSADVRQRAAYALGPLGGDEAVRLLCEVLPHTSGDELMSVAGALGRLASPGSVDPLLQAIKQTTERHSLVSLVHAARQSGEDSRAFEALMSHFGHDGQSTFQCLAALVDLHEPRAVPTVKDLLSKTADSEIERVAKLYLKQHGVVLQPQQTSQPMFAAKVAKEVKFLRKHTKGKSTYEVHQGDTADAARQFLLKKQMTAPCYYVVVETPEGNWGLDVNGLYLESLLPWQSDLSKADVVGRAAEGLGSVDSAKAASLGYADNWIHGVICGKCGCEWLDGLRLNKDTVVRCPKCTAMNRVTPPPRDFWVRG
jgi:hypothetical protein